MTDKTFKNKSKWLSLVAAAISLATTVSVQTQAVFQSGNEAQALLLISTIAAMITLVFGIITIPRWQGFVALITVTYVGYPSCSRGYTPLTSLSWSGIRMQRRIWEI